ncbi:single-stranded-DNA-specific exonuclease RecJ [Holophaga foetida]|uniref:single-stranded-DNA-specific exonuclease RecJ n=1 Tax=Holophaga foetida TaxID=35839 RepID=UPI0002473AC5|nr:DHH family phosphoesterase [Holophaga foetida]
MMLRPWCLRRAVASGPVAWGRLAREWSLPEDLARLAWLRGADHPEDLAWRLDPAWERSYDPFLMTGMGEAVARVRQAVAAMEPILVYGDYDADGVTATALLVRVLERMGAAVSFFIPNRFSDGYGLHLDCIRQLADAGKRGLFISVDCGVNSCAEVAASREWGIDWIITDHHAMGEELPAARAVLHPGRGNFPNTHLSGVGVAFKLAQALMDAVPFPRGGDAAFLDGLLKLVALGTVADMVPLQGENALLVRRGLAALNGANAPGLAALLRTAKVEGRVKGQDLAFNVAPRLNAVGRLGGAEDAVHLLLCRDAKEAATLAEQVEKLNAERRTIQDELMQRLPSPGAEAFDFVLDPEAHKGVIGVVAGNRMRNFARPSAVCTLMDGVAHCSLRAPEGYNLSEILDQARPFLISGGGHRLAGGMTFEAAKLPFVRKVFERGAAEQSIVIGVPPLDTDGGRLDLVPRAEELERLEPFGQGFPTPLVVVEGALQAPPNFFKDRHCKLRLGGAGEPLTWFSCEHDLEVGSFQRLAVSPMDSARWGRSWKVETPVAAGVES